jgi:deoxyribodipyrimidine photo-lyase
LQQSLSQVGGRLYYCKGESLAELQALIEASGAGRVFWNRRYEGPQRERDAAIKKALREAGIEVQSFNSRLLNEPHTVSTGSGQAYKVYTPYWKKVKDRKIEPPVEPDLKAAHFYTGAELGCGLSDLGLLPAHPWHEKLAAYWEVSEDAVIRQFDQFLAGPVEGYDTNRDLPMVAGTSSL